MAEDRAPIEPPLPNWPILLTAAMAARYLSVDEHSFGIIVEKSGVCPVDLGLPLVRWRRSELDRLVGRLPSAPPLEAAVRSTSAPDPAEVMVQRIVQGVTQRVAAQPAEPRAHALSLKDAAKMIGISRSTLYRLVGEGWLPTARVGSRVLVKRSDVEALFNEQPSAAPDGRKGRR